MATYTGTLGESHAYPEVTKYLGVLGFENQLPRLWLGALGGRAALWASVWQGTIGAAPRQDGEALVVDPTTVVQVLYPCTLTDGGSGLGDLDLPLTSFQAEYRPAAEDGSNQSRLTVTVPNAVEWAAAIRDRLDGDVIIYRKEIFAGGTTSSTELLRVPLDSTQDQRGGRRTSIQLRGFIPREGGGDRNVKIPEIFTWSVDETGRVRFRAPPNSLLRPGDQVTVDDKVYLTTEIQYRVTSREAWIEVVTTEGAVV